MPNLPFSLGNLGYIYLILGEWEKSEQYFKEALDLSQKLNQYPQIATNSIQLGSLYGVYRGEYAKAREFLEKAVEICEKAGAKYYQMFISCTLIYLYIELGDLQEASDLLDSVQTFACEIKDTFLTPRTEALRGMLLRAQMKWEESIEHFEKSLQEYESINARRWLLYHFARFFLFEYARVYLERDQEGDREKAHNLLNQALEIFQKMGAKKEVERIIAKKKLLTA
jgi:tetratricopeptide (TPR) repeat protein